MMLITQIKDVEDRMAKLMNDFIHAIETDVIPALDLELAELLVLTFSDTLDCLLDKLEKGVDIKGFTERYA
jgi:hypothetical protein